MTVIGISRMTVMIVTGAKTVPTVTRESVSSLKAVPLNLTDHLLAIDSPPPAHDDLDIAE